MQNQVKWFHLRTRVDRILSHFGTGSDRGSPNGTIGNFTNGVPIVPLGEPMVSLALPLVQMVLPMVPLVKP